MAAHLNYHHLRLFRAVARAGTLTSAAQQLGLTPQTVSEQVRRFEEALGAALLDRSGRALVPTPTGRLVAQYADEIFERGRELLEVVRQRESDRPLHAVIGIAPSMPKTIVQHLLEPIFALDRRVHVTCRQDRVERLLGQLAVHDLDVVLSDAPAPRHLKLNALERLLGSCGVTLMAAPRLAAAHRAGGVASLDDAPFLMPVVGTALRRLLDGWLAQHGLHPAVVGEFEDSALAKEVASAGFGVLAVPSVIADEVGARHGLETLFELEDVEERFYAICPRLRLTHPAVAAMAECAQSELFAAGS